MIIWVLTKNPYRRFYKKINGVIVGHNKITVDNIPLSLTAYGWKDLGLLRARLAQKNNTIKGWDK